MKFGKRLATQVFPVWSRYVASFNCTEWRFADMSADQGDACRHYMDYKTLKKLLKRTPQNENKSFFFALDRELEKVLSCFSL
jgi:SPX domain protein involved in polyphosphate accumulation